MLWVYRTRSARLQRVVPARMLLRSLNFAGTPELCIWNEDAAPPLYDARVADETIKLKQEGRYPAAASMTVRQLSAN